MPSPKKSVNKTAKKTRINGPTVSGIALKTVKTASKVYDAASKLGSNAYRIAAPRVSSVVNAASSRIKNIDVSIRPVQEKRILERINLLLTKDTNVPNMRPVVTHQFNPSDIDIVPSKINYKLLKKILDEDKINHDNEIKRWLREAYIENHNMELKRLQSVDPSTMENAPTDEEVIYFMYNLLKHVKENKYVYGKTIGNYKRFPGVNTTDMQAYIESGSVPITIGNLQYCVPPDTSGGRKRKTAKKTQKRRSKR